MFFGKGRFDDAIEVTPAMFDAMEAQFEPATADELNQAAAVATS
ncbi:MULTISPECIES: hypothetical protein [Chromobacterium]|nr:MULTISPECIES: hypothetical protein [Chromobacterium]WSE90325.1 hypothetical protein U6115_15700 [Chromobacterium subtsugae]WVH58697.1 hypothetical protein U6151_15725 [Chromobacterium subtsugae]